MRSRHTTRKRTQQRTSRMAIAGLVLFAAPLLVCAPLSPNLAVAQDVSASQTDAEFLSGLRHRQLYDLAESYCLRVLEQEDLPLERLSDIVVQLSQTLASHATQTRGDQGNDLWDRAYATAEQFAAEHEDSPWSTVVRAQAVMVILNRGIWTRQRAEVAGNNPRLIEEAKTYLRDALDKIESLTPELLETLSKRGVAIDRTIPSRDQLLALQKNLRYQTALAYIQQGLCYPPLTPDYEAALIEATRILDELAGLNAIDPLVWSARLEATKCYRLRGVADLAQRRLDTLLAEDPPPEVVLDARAEQVRIHLSKNDLPAALQVFEAGFELQGRRSAELDFALLETALARWKLENATKSEEAEDWKNLAIDRVKLIQRHHDPYWGLRAQTLLASSMTGAALTGDMAMLAGNAQALLQQERIDDALELFDQAVVAAEDAKQPEEAFQLGYQAAVIQHERLEHVDAMRRCREISLKYPSNAEAPDAHLLAIHNAAESARAATTPDLSEYVTLLKEHQSTWPLHDTTGQVVWALARVEEHRQEWEKSAATYLQIPPQDSNAIPGILASARVYRQWLSGRRAKGEDVEGPAKQAASIFEAMVLGKTEPLTWPERWSPAQREAALAAVELRLLFTADPYERCIQILEKALQANPIAPDEWRVRLKSSYIWALVGSANEGNSNLQTARQMVDSLGDAQASSLITLLAGLSQVAKQFPPEKQREIGEMQLDAVRPLYARIQQGEVQLDDSERRQLPVLAAAATASAGYLDTAIQQYSQLHQQYPRDGEIIEAYAETLLNANDAKLLPDALDLWRKIERGSEAGSPRWFRAKLGLAATHAALGDKEQGAKIILVTQALHPKLGGPELKAQFKELLDRCQK